MRSVARGLTLVEVLITMTIFIGLAAFTIMAVREVVAQWTQSERRRVLYENSSGCLETIADDIRLTLTQEPAGVSEIKARMIGDVDPETHNQRLMFVRTFETGPERALTFFAGNGQINNVQAKAPGKAAPADSAQSDVPPLPKGGGDDFTGLKMGNYKALGGLAMVAYFTKNQTLYRVIHAPVPDEMTPLLTPENAQAIAPDVLYLGFEYWSQYTDTWEAPKAREKNNGPEYIWDSTRGLDTPLLRKFRLHRGADSLNDKDDDVFPEKIRVTLTTDSPMPRCVNTSLVDEVSDNGLGRIYVDSTRSFPDGGDDDSYLLIDDEWMHYRKRGSDTFEIDARGARGTTAHGHFAKAVVRTGRTFRRVVYLPTFREDLMPDEVWRAKKDLQRSKNTRSLLR